MGQPPKKNDALQVLHKTGDERKYWRTAYRFLMMVFFPVPLANIGDDRAHGDLAIRGAFKIADYFTGGYHPFKPLLGDGVLNITGSV